MDQSTEKWSQVFAALELVDKARTRLRSRPGYSIPIHPSLIRMAEGELDRAIELMTEALKPF